VSSYPGFVTTAARAVDRVGADSEGHKLSFAFRADFGLARFDAEEVSVSTSLTTKALSDWRPLWNIELSTVGAVSRRMPGVLYQVVVLIKAELRAILLAGMACSG
jgi:hypothetical protein